MLVVFRVLRLSCKPARLLDVLSSEILLTASVNYCTGAVANSPESPAPQGGASPGNRGRFAAVISCLKEREELPRTLVYLNLPDNQLTIEHPFIEHICSTYCYSSLSFQLILPVERFCSVRSRLKNATMYSRPDPISNVYRTRKHYHFPAARSTFEHYKPFYLTENFRISLIS
jgi:hypothetical protein